MDSAELARLEPDQLKTSVSYEEAVALSSRLANGSLSFLERAEIGLALADEQLDNEPEDRASPDERRRALVTLEATEADLGSRDLWTSEDAMAAREMMVRLLDRQASLLLAMGNPVAAFLKADLARTLAADFGEDESDSAMARAELMMEAARQSGREDFIGRAHDAMDATGIQSGFADVIVGNDAEEMAMSSDMDGFEAATPPAVMSAPAPESFPDISAPPAPESMRAPTPSARRRSRARASQTSVPEETGTDLPYHEVPIFFATHRNQTGRENPYDYFRGKRAPLSLGRAVVTVPKMREAGDFAVAKRNSWKRADKAKLITIDTIDLIGDRSQFLDEIREDISESKRKEALVFVHGFNTSFAGALQRAGQLSVDLDIDGATLMYSWPSKGSLLSYVVDRNQVVYEFLDDLQNLIVDVALETGAERVHLLAHSMGCQFLLDSIHAALLNPKVQALGGQPIADEIIFASPDVDAQNFTSKLSQARGLARRITVYSSREDRALLASQTLQGGIRAGQAPDIIGAAGFDAIDTTAAEQDFLGHSDYSKSAIDDVRAVIWVPQDVSPAKRDAILKPDSGGTHWIFRGDEVVTTGLPFRRALRFLRSNGVEAGRSIMDLVGQAGDAVEDIDDHVRAELRKLLT